MKKNNPSKNSNKKINALRLFAIEQLSYDDLYQLVFEQVDDEVIIITDLEGNIKVVNQKTTEMLLYKPEELKKLNAKKLLYLSDEKELYNFTKESFPPGVLCQTVDRYLVKKDGSLILVEIEAKFVPTAKRKKPKFIVNFLRDIKKHNELLKVFVKHFTQSREGYVILKEDGTIYVANPEFIKLVEKPLTDIKTKKIWSLCPEFLLVKEFQELLASNSSGHKIIEIEKDDGKKIAMDLTTQVITLENKKFVQCLCRDITEQRQKNHKIAMQQQLLKKQKSELETFAANIAHDIKGKLQAIAIYNDLMKAKLPKTVDYPKKIAELINEIVQFIDNSLLLAKEGEILGELEQFDLEKVIKKIIEKISILNPTIKVRMEKLPRIFGDKKKIYLVFENLLLNAFRHSSATEVIVSTAEEDKYIVVKIIDNGKGIPKEKQQQIISGWETGTFYSFGLMIVKKIVDAHHGTVSFESKEGKGTTFSVRLPKRKNE